MKTTIPLLFLLRRVDTPREAAALVKAGRSLGLGGTVFGVPIPAENEAVGGGLPFARAHTRFFLFCFLYLLD